MSMLDVHGIALSGGNPVYHAFLLRYKADHRVVYGHVEGKEDPHFYRGFIEAYLPAGWNVELLPSGRKEAVLQALTAFDWSRFSSSRICFFVDRDLSECTQESCLAVENLYITDNYSIENDVVTFSTVMRVLAEVFGVWDLDNSEVDTIRNLFESGLSAFQHAMAPIMAQIVLWRIAKLRISLDNIKPRDFFEFSAGALRLRPQFQDAGTRLAHVSAQVHAPLAPASELAQAELEFWQIGGPARLTRGKYVMWFFCAFVQEVHSSLPAIIKRYSKSPKVTVSFGTGNAMVFAAPRARCPQSLRDFIDSTYCAYVRQRP